MSGDPGFAAVTSLLREVVLRLERIESAVERNSPAVLHDSSERLWTATEVGEFLGRSKRSVYQLAAEGVLPTLRVGGHLRFDPERVRRWARGPSAK